MGLTVKMLKNICSEKAAQKAQAFAEAKQTATTYKRGAEELLEEVRE